MAQHELLPGEHSLQQQFDSLALELFAIQFKANPAYGKICTARQLTPAIVRHWAQIPFVPTGAFKELELSCIAPGNRTAVFHSSGTTEQKPSRHFHSAESLALYEVSLWRWFKARFSVENEFVFLTPDQPAAPHSSLVYMFETVRKNARTERAEFFGGVAAGGAWTINFDCVVHKLRRTCDDGKPLTILGTAFSFVHLLDFMADNSLQFNLPGGSLVMETGGYKNRSRAMPKSELHALITEHLGVPGDNITCEYGMSELSSQAYDSILDRRGPPQLEAGLKQAGARPGTPISRHFRFPPWAKVQIISPENGHEVAEGETGLIRIFDLANVFSVAAIQTEDLGIRHGHGFDLVGRIQLAEARGCSLMTA